jgi:hypothetical protein
MMTPIDQVTAFVKGMHQAQDQKFDAWYSEFEANLYRRPLEAQLSEHFRRQLRTLAFLAWLDGHLHGQTEMVEHSKHAVSEVFETNPHRRELVQ